LSTKHKTVSTREPCSFFTHFILVYCPWAEIFMVAPATSAGLQKMQK
jgi:hypothetical protein